MGGSAGEDDGTPRIIGKGCSSSMEEEDSRVGSLNSDDDKINTMMATGGEQQQQLICDAKSSKATGLLPQYNS